MKFRDLVINIISVLFIIPLYYFTKGHNIFLYTISLYLYLIISSMFLHINIYDNLKKYYDKKQIYSLNVIYKYTNISIIIINIFISLILWGISILLNSLFNIKGFVVVNICMSLTLFIIPILKNVSSFVSVYGFKKLGDNVINFYKILSLILLIISSFICFKIVNIPDYISIIIMYSTLIMSFSLVYIFCYLLVLSNKIKKKQFKTRDERIDYKKEIIDILSRNNNASIINIIKYSYFYISIVILYFLLKNRYGYSYLNTSNVINNNYLYASLLIVILLFIINYFEYDNLDKIINNVKKKNFDNIKLDDYLIGLFKRLLTMVVIFSIVSDAVWTLVFNSDDGYILYMFSGLMLFYVLYSFIIRIVKNCISDKKMYIILIIGLIIKLLLVVPLVSSLYRLGYNLLYGDMISSIVSYFLVSILFIISTRNKCKVDFISKFDKILDIIYYNIILCLILLLFTFIVPVKVSTRLEGIIVLIVYLVISFIYIYIRKRLGDKNERIIVRN